MTTYDVPAHGEPNWDGKINPSLQYLKDTAEAAETPAGAQAKATAAQNAAISAAATDATSKANTAQANAIASAASDATTKANSVQSNLNTHVGNVANPHSVTKAQVGLGNVPNVDATARANHTGTQTAATISDLDTATGNNVTGGAQTKAALDGAYVRLNKRPIHAADYGVSAANGDNSTAFANALSAAGGVALHLPAGNLVIAQAGRYLITAANTALIGDRSASTTLRFTNASGGIDIGDGTNYVYVSQLRDLIIDGNAGCANPLRFRRSEEAVISNVRIRNATSANVVCTGSNLMWIDNLCSTDSPVGWEFGADNGSFVFSRCNMHQDTDVFRMTGASGVSSVVFKDSWVENCNNFVTYANAGWTGHGRFLVRDSWFTSTGTTLRLAYALAGPVGNDPDVFEVTDCTINGASVTTPLIDFTALDNTSATYRVALKRLRVNLAAYTTQTLVAVNAAQGWYNFYANVGDIAGLSADRWHPANQVAGGVRYHRQDISGIGTPNGSQIGFPGWTYTDEGGGAGVSFYVKESGQGTNTGWVAK